MTTRKQDLGLRERCGLCTEFASRERKPEEEEEELGVVGAERWHEHAIYSHRGGRKLTHEEGGGKLSLG